MATATTITPVQVVSQEPYELLGVSSNAKHLTTTHSQMGPTISDAITPRRYQEEIFAQAQHSNVIAVLSTGSGKTYISILLIKFITSQLQLSAGKVVVFLVPKVRHHTYLQCHL